MDDFYIQVEPVVDLQMRKLCCRPYYNHKNGCINFNKKKDCPPNCPVITDVLDFSEPIYAIYNVFNFGSHVTKMKKKHPEWTKRQCECCLYWQPKARKQLREKIQLFLKYFLGYYIVRTPEGQGVNITETMKQKGIILEWPPQKEAYQIVIAGIKK